IIPCGQGTWAKFGYAEPAASAHVPMGSVVYGRLPDQPFGIDFEYRDRLAAAGAWEAPDTYVVRICQYRTTFVQTVRLKFSEREVTVTASQNVGFDRTDAVPLTGR
ncbi:MAG TPA: hypothetical protein VGM73_01175, partial [Candidatus Didemnitutus sp.]